MCMILRKRTLTRFILEKIGEAGLVYFDAFFPRQYSYARISREFFGVDAYPETNPRTVSSLLVRLRREGLVARRKREGKDVWILTKRGAGRLKRDVVAPVPASDGISRLVIFDIPERERRKRDAIRAELIACNFTRLQKSVWMGSNPLPEDFIALVDDLRLDWKVHIFSIQGKGTLQEI